MNRTFAFLALALMLTGLCIPDPADCQTSHMGQAVKEHVTLLADAALPSMASCGPGFQNMDFYRVFPDATRSSTSFDVPAGQLLVITDVEWHARKEMEPGNAFHLEVYLDSNLTDQVPGVKVFMSSAAWIQGPGFAGSNDQLTTGFVVAPGSNICPMLIESGAPTPTAGIHEIFPQWLILRGYLIRRS